MRTIKNKSRLLFLLVVLVASGSLALILNVNKPANEILPALVLEIPPNGPKAGAITWPHPDIYQHDREIIMVNVPAEVKSMVPIEECIDLSYYDRYGSEYKNSIKMGKICPRVQLERTAYRYSERLAEESIADLNKKIKAISDSIKEVENELKKGKESKIVENDINTLPQGGVMGLGKISVGSFPGSRNIGNYCLKDSNG